MYAGNGVGFWGSVFAAGTNIHLLPLWYSVRSAVQLFTEN